MVDPDVTFLQRQVERVLGDNADMRDRMMIQHAILTRIENTMIAMQTNMASLQANMGTVIHELQGLNARLDRQDGRLRKIEEREP